MEFVRPDIVGLRQIVFQEMGIPLEQITDNTRLKPLTERIANICALRFGRLIDVPTDAIFGDLRRQLGV